MTPERETVARLAELITRSRSTVVLTGAGISVPSGIPDFRSATTGLWQRVDPLKVATIDVFHNDTEAFWRFYRPRFHDLGAKLPNRAHRIVAEFEQRGLIEGVVTQNIDLLHAKAGSKRIWEVHGSIASSGCIDCGRAYRLAEVDRCFDAVGVARCADCDGKIKPNVVLFGEMLPEQVIDEASAIASAADLIICIGSSLEVYPVAALPELTLAAGGQIAIVTQGPTPYDGDAAVKLDGDAIADLEAVLAALG